MSSWVDISPSAVFELASPEAGIEPGPFDLSRMGMHNTAFTKKAFWLEQRAFDLRFTDMCSHEKLRVF